jgi:hypothetical protein
LYHPEVGVGFLDGERNLQRFFGGPDVWTGELDIASDASNIGQRNLAQLSGTPVDAENSGIVNGVTIIQVLFPWASYITLLVLHLSLKIVRI